MSVITNKTTARALRDVIAQAKSDALANIAKEPKRRQSMLKDQLEIDLKKYEAILREKQKVKNKRGDAEVAHSAANAAMKAEALK
jgi:hypothetical protein